MSDTHIQNPILHSSQEILNESFNNTYKIIENALYLYQASTNTFVPATADSTGKLQVAGGVSGGGGLTIPGADYLSLSQTSTTDVYTYFTGGSGGTLVATVTINYTDSSKATIANVAVT